MTKFRIEETEHFRIHYGFEAHHFTGTHDEPGEDKARNLYVEVLRAFSVEDFEAPQCDEVKISDSSRRAYCNVTLELTDAAAQEWASVLHASGFDYVNWRVYGDTKYPRVRETVEAEYHYKGCRNDAQREQRREQAKAAVRALLDKGAYVESMVHHFNGRVAQVVEVLNREYRDEMVRNLAEVDREWLLKHAQPDTARELRQLAADWERVNDVFERVRDHRRELSKRLTATHRRATLAVWVDEAWEVNGAKLPQEVSDTIAAELAPEQDPEPPEVVEMPML
jgi:hypothetical protein